MTEFRVIKSYDHNMGLSACFRQWRAESHCRFLHGYALAFDVEFACDQLCKNNWVINFGGLKPLKAALAENFDHRMIVANDDPKKHVLLELGEQELAQPLVMPDVGCEMFAEFVAGLVTNLLNEHFPTDVDERGLRLVSVRCREHSGNSAKVFVDR